MPGQSDASSSRQRDVRDQAMSEISGALEQLDEPPVRIRQVVPLGRVDDEPVDDADDLLELGRAPRRLAAPAEEHGQVGDQERLDDRRRRLGTRSLQLELDDLRAHGPVDAGHGVALERDRGVDRSCRSPGRGSSMIVRDGCRSAIPPSASRACSRHSSGTHAMCVITEVRVFGGPPWTAVAARSSASALPPAEPDVRAAPALHDGGRAQWRRHERPSRWIRSSALGGPQVPAA